MSFTFTDIITPSKKRYLFEEDDTIQKISGTEIEEPESLFENKTFWFSVANYESPHLTDSTIVSSTLAVEIETNNADRYRSIMKEDLELVFQTVQQDSDTVLLIATEPSELTDFQRYQLASYPDIRDCELDAFTDPAVSYNQNQQELDFSSTYGSGMSHRVYMNIHEKLDKMLQKEDSVEEIKTYLTGRKTEQRAEQIYEVLKGNKTESVLYELGSLKPKKAFSQLIDKLYQDAIIEVSIPINYTNLLTDVEYIKVKR